MTQPSACSQNKNMPYLRGPLRVIVKTQASPDVRFKKNGDRVLIFPLSRALLTEIKELLCKVG